MAHRAPGQLGGEPVQCGERAGGLGSCSSSARQALRSWPMTVAALQAVADAVADDDADPPVGSSTVSYQSPPTSSGRVAGCVAHREPGGQLGRAEDRALQREGGFALLVDLVYAVQPLAEVTGQQGQQGLVLLGDGRALSAEARSTGPACRRGARRRFPTPAGLVRRPW